LDKRRYVAFLAIIFLIQFIIPSKALSDTNFSLPQIKVAAYLYYPFFINDKELMMGIFLTQEKLYQHAAPILCEGNIEDHGGTFQTLPSLNEILADCKIKPHQFYSTYLVDSSA